MKLYRSLVPLPHSRRIHPIGHVSHIRYSSFRFAVIVSSSLASQPESHHTWPTYWRITTICARMIRAMGCRPESISTNRGGSFSGQVRRIARGDLPCTHSCTPLNTNCNSCIAVKHASRSVSVASCIRSRTASRRQANSEVWTSLSRMIPAEMSGLSSQCSKTSHRALRTVLTPLTSCTQDRKASI